MTPSDLDVLIHCHVSPIPHPRLGSSIVRDTIKRFEEDGVVEKVQGEDYYVTTSFGKAWLESILRTPMPKRVWVDEGGNIIE